MLVLGIIFADPRPADFGIGSVIDARLILLGYFCFVLLGLALVFTVVVTRALHWNIEVVVTVAVVGTTLVDALPVNLNISRSFLGNSILFFDCDPVPVEFAWLLDVPKQIFDAFP